MGVIPEGKEVKHRYAIETTTDTYQCDNYTIYPSGVLCICIYPEYTDVFMIVGAVEAFHDFSAKMTLEMFNEAQEKDIQASKAIKKPTNADHHDVNCQ